MSHPTAVPTNAGHLADSCGAFSPGREFRCRREPGHDGPHRAPLGAGTVQWADKYAKGVPDDPLDDPRRPARDRQGWH